MNSTKEIVERVRAAMPAKLLQLPVWLVWKSVPGDDKPKKVPYYASGAARHGSMDSAEDRARLADFEAAVAALNTDKYTGLGIALGEVPGEEIRLAGIDLDGCYNGSGDLDERAAQVLMAAQSYAEKSPSGTGLHVLGTGDLGTTKKDERGLEIYSGRRFFTVTGEVINSAGIEDLTDAAAMARRLYQVEATAATKSNGSANGHAVLDGGRNHYLSREAFRLRKQGATPEQILEVLRALNAARCSPPLGDHELQQIAGGKARIEPEPEEEAPPLFDPVKARGRVALLDAQPENVEVIVRDLLRRTAGVRAGAGGSSKSTLVLYEMVHIILAGVLYGREVMRSGPCVLLTAEDERQVAEYRLFRIMEALELSRPQREQVLANLYIEDMTTHTCRFVDLAENGTLQQTFAVPEFIDRYRAIAPAFVSIDPMNFFGPGERFVNDGEGELMRAGRRISLGLNAAVRFEHHTGKTQARERSTDQYTGRGGSAGADNARFVHVLQVHSTEDKAYTAPKACSSVDIASGNVLRLHVAKDSYGQRLAMPLWILRTGFLFTHMKPDPAEDVDPIVEQVQKLYAFIETESANGIRHTANTLDSRLKDIGLSRQELRASLHVALERDHLLEQDLPKEEQHGRRKTYLATGLRP